jgi:hypothetical protein
MKLKGISLIVPISDLRPILAPLTRLQFLSPYAAIPGSTRLKGFGSAGERKLSNPWRAADTIFFYCNGAVELPKRLPDGAGVHLNIRRVYLDDAVTIRLDFALFASPRRHTRSAGHLETWVNDFWNGDFVFHDDHPLEPPVACPSAFEKVVNKLIKASSQGQSVRYDLVKALDPLLIVEVEADEEYLRNEPVPLDTERTLFAEVLRFSLSRFNREVKTVLVAHVPGHYLRQRQPEFVRLRYARLIPAWLHVDLQVLLSLMRHAHGTQTPRNLIAPYIDDLADSLSYVALASRKAGLSVGVFKNMYANSVDLAVEGLRNLGLAKAAEKLQSAFESPSDTTDSESYFQKPAVEKAGGELKYLPLDSLVREACQKFSSSLLGESTETNRYDDAAFRESAVRKAADVATRIPKAGPYVILSVGGADGTELFELMALTGSSSGVLLEFSERSVELATQEARRRGVFVETLTGDAMQKVNEAMRAAVSLSQKAKGIPVLVTIMALLHELPTRSPGFDLLDFFAALNKADILIGREPIEPPNWQEQVILSGDFDADLFVRFVNDIVVGRYQRLRSGSEKVSALRVAPHAVRAPRGVILEALVKVLYVPDLLYELNEWFTWFKPEQLIGAVRTCFGTTHHVDWEPITSQSIRKLWRCHALSAWKVHATEGAPAPLPIPASHLWYQATRNDLTRL